MNSKFFLHLLILLFVQLVVIDNIYLGMYVYLNIYYLSILVAPPTIKKTPLLLISFLLGLTMDMAHHTIGIHAATGTTIAFLRPKFLMLLTGKSQGSEIGIANNQNFYAYILISVLSYNTLLIFLEAFTFTNFFIIMSRVILSTLLSYIFIYLYSIIAFKSIRK